MVGTGLMGSGIAVAALDAGYRVIGVEQTAEAAAKGRDRIVGLLDRAVASGRLDTDGRAARLDRLAVTANAGDVADADLVIEAVFDDLAVKTGAFQQLDGIVRPDAILATNTSYLDPDVIAAATSRPERVLGLHFFSPANVMRLLEVVRGAKTAPDVLATGIAVARKLGKLPVVSGVCEGFIGNRIFSAYRREAEFMLEDGALPHEIDAAMERYGFAMGPFAVFDLAGLEIAWARRKRQAATRDPAERYVDIADRLCEAGRFGQKTGRGWYAYPEGKRAIDPEVTAMIEASRAAKGIVPRQHPGDGNRLAPACRNGGGGQGDPGGRHRRTGRRHRSGDDQRLRLSGPQGRTDVRRGLSWRGQMTPTCFSPSSMSSAEGEPLRTKTAGFDRGAASASIRLPCRFRLRSTDRPTRRLREIDLVAVGALVEHGRNHKVGAEQELIAQVQRVAVVRIMQEQMPDHRIAAMGASSEAFSVEGEALVDLRSAAYAPACRHWYRIVPRQPIEPSWVRKPP